MWLWATWSLKMSLQQVWTRGPLRDPSNSNESLVCFSDSVFLCKAQNCLALARVKMTLEDSNIILIKKINNNEHFCIFPSPLPLFSLIRWAVWKTDAVYYQRQVINIFYPRSYWLHSVCLVSQIQLIGNPYQLPWLCYNSFSFYYTSFHFMEELVLDSHLPTTDKRFLS